MDPFPEADQPDPMLAEGHSLLEAVFFLLPHLLQMPGLHSIKKVFEVLKSASYLDINMFLVSLPVQ